MKRSPLNKVSAKQASKSRAWGKICADKIEALFRRCETCGGTYRVSGHHIIPRRFNNNTPENCKILCQTCHDAETLRPKHYAKDGTEIIF